MFAFEKMCFDMQYVCLVGSDEIENNCLDVENLACIPQHFEIFLIMLA